MNNKIKIIWTVSIILFISVFVLVIVQLSIYPGFFIDYLYNNFSCISNEFSNIKNLIVNIACGVFTSSFVTLVITYKEYKEEERKILRDYVYKLQEFFDYMRKQDYICVDINHRQVVAECVAAKIMAKYDKEERSQRPSREKEKELKDLFEADLSIENLTKEKIKQIVDSRYWTNMTNCEQAVPTFLQYVETADRMNSIKNELTQIYQEMRFLKKNKKLKVFIYENIHDKIMKVCKLRNEANLSFQIHKTSPESSKYNVQVCLCKLYDVQDVTYEAVQDETCIKVYNNFKYEIELALYELNNIIFKTYNNDISKPNKEDYIFLKQGY